MTANHFITLALLGTSLAACSADSDPSEIGGTAPGATLSGVIRNRIGGALDNEDKRRAYAARLQALETGPSGAPVAWRNPESGRYGNVVPGPAYQANGATCRHFTNTVFIDSKPQFERGTACRTPDGTWTNVN